MVDAVAIHVMHYQTNRNYVSNDEVQTPPALAHRIVRHFRPCGRGLEPCCGEGTFCATCRAKQRGAKLGAAGIFRVEGAG